MNRDQIIANAKLKLNYNSTQTDVDFQDEDFVTGLQEVYNDEVLKGSDTALYNNFKRLTTFTWADGEVTVEVPTEIQGKTILKMIDITGNSDLGDELQFGDYGEFGQVFWKDKKTLQWDTTGPSSDRTIQVQYIEVPEQLLSPASVPELLPEQFHYLLTWSLAIYMKELAEELAPLEWQQKLVEQRTLLYRFFEKGKPTSDVPAIKPFSLTSGGFGS